MTIMAKIMGYWDAANIREPVFVEFFSAVTGESFILKVKLTRIDDGMLVYVDDTDFGHPCMKKDYNVWDIFGWRPWTEKPTDAERKAALWLTPQR